MGEEQRLQKLRRTAEAINKRISSSCDPVGLDERLGDVFQLVSETYRGREWPETVDFVRAMKDTHDSVGHVSQHSPDEAMTEWARQLWFHGTQRCPARTAIAPANTWEIAKQLIREGADPWEIRNSNFETDTRYFRDLEERGQGWDGHHEVIDRLREGFMGAAA